MKGVVARAGKLDDECVPQLGPHARPAHSNHGPAMPTRGIGCRRETTQFLVRSDSPSHD